MPENLDSQKDNTCVTLVCAWIISMLFSLINFESWLKEERILGLISDFVRMSICMCGISCFSKLETNSPPLEAMVMVLITRPQRKAGDINRAIKIAERAVGLSGQRDARALITLADAYAEAGRFDKAVRAGQSALALAAAGRDEKMTAHIRNRLEFYKKAKH